jgi:predicted dehydrogenase
MPGAGPISRRSFLETSAATAAVSVVARHALGSPRFVPPSDKITVGYVGSGTQGLRNLMGALKSDDLKITAICDPNRKSDDYIGWSATELGDKVRAFLDDPSWGKKARGALCGREVGQEIVDRHYGASGGGGCATYADFREMLAMEKDLDAVYVMTPDHLHATVALAAMKAGKHVIMHKPLGNVHREARLASAAAAETGVATHMFCAAGSPSAAEISEWIWNGAIGAVREVHNWSSRPFWPQGMTDMPKEEKVPKGLDWDLWLGPVPHRPYSPRLTHAVFRGWYDFGSGALGDMGHYAFHQIFEILKLGAPLTVEASRSQEWKIVDFLWQRQENLLSYPRASKIRWEFPAREGMPPVTLHWYDGGLRPPTIPELEEDGEEMPAEGMLFVGDDGKILCRFTGGAPRLLPKRRMDMFKAPPERLERPVEELEQWIRACRCGPPSDASFTAVAPFAETILLGNVALRVPKKLHWKADEGRFADAPEADALLGREYRKGWEL